MQEEIGVLSKGDKMEEFIKTLLIACIPAVVSGVVSFFVSKSQANSEIKKLKNRE